MFVEDVDLLDVKNAFEKVIKDINLKKTQLKQNRKELRNNLYKLYGDKERNEKEISFIQEKFEETTYKLKAMIEISRIIEDSLFEYDIEIEKEASDEFNNKIATMYDCLGEVYSQKEVEEYKTLLKKKEELDKEKENLIKQGWLNE